MTIARLQPRFGLIGQTGYASGNFGKSLLWSTTEYFLLFYMTEAVGMPPTQAGVLILLSLVLDATLGMIVGFAADRTATPLGKYGPYLAFGAPFVALTFWFVFAPSSAGDVLRVALALFAFRIAYVICDVPHNALMARVVRNDKDAATISGLRLLFSSLGAFAAATAVGSALAGADRHAGAAVVSAAAAAYLAALWVAFAATHAIDRALPNRAVHVPLRQAVRLLLANRTLGGLLVLAVVQVVTLPLFTKGLAYWGAHHHGDGEWSARALGITAAAQGLSIFGWVLVGRRRPPLWMARAAYGTVGVSGLVFASATMLDAPLAETAALVVYGVGHGGAVSALWALLPGVIRAGGVPGGPEVESLPTGVFLFALKAGAGLGTALLGALLGGIGLAPVPAPGFDHRLGLLLSAVLVLGSIASLAATLLVARTIPSSGTPAAQNYH